MKNSLLLILVSTSVMAQGIPIKSGSSSDLMTVDTNKNANVAIGKSTKATYVATVGSQATTAAVSLSIEAEASRGFRVVQICYTASGATAAAAVTFSVQRRTTASTAGTVVASEATTNSVSKLDPADSNWSGVVRLGGTVGTAGAMLYQQGYQVGTTSTGSPQQCLNMGYGNSKEAIVQAGLSNGLSFNISASGTGGLASGSINVVFVGE